VECLAGRLNDFLAEELADCQEKGCRHASRQAAGADKHAYFPMGRWRIFDRGLPIGRGACRSRNGTRAVAAVAVIVVAVGTP
jgi:hypothetical protein